MKQMMEDILLISLVKITLQLLKQLASLKKFRLAYVEIKNSENQITCNSLNDFNKSLLLNKYKNYIENLNIKIDFNLINQIENEELIKFIAMSCQFSTADKQMLLETYNLSDLANKLISLFEFYHHTQNNKNLFN